MNAAVGIALLSNARVTPSWHTVESFPLIASGLGPINASIATDPGTSPLAFLVVDLQSSLHSQFRHTNVPNSVLSWK